MPHTLESNEMQKSYLLKLPHGLWAESRIAAKHERRSLRQHILRALENENERVQPAAEEDADKD